MSSIDPLQKSLSRLGSHSPPPPVTEKPAIQIAASLEVSTPLQFIPGIGPQRVELFHKLGVRRATDLLFLFPRSYQDIAPYQSITELEPGLRASVIGQVVDMDQRVSFEGRSSIGILLAVDGGGYGLKGKSKPKSPKVSNEAHQRRDDNAAAVKQIVAKMRNDCIARGDGCKTDYGNTAAFTSQALRLAVQYGSYTAAAAAYAPAPPPPPPPIGVPPIAGSGGPGTNGSAPYLPLVSYIDLAENFNPSSQADLLAALINYQNAGVNIGTRNASVPSVRSPASQNSLIAKKTMTSGTNE